MSVLETYNDYKEPQELNEPLYSTAGIIYDKSECERFFDILIETQEEYKAFQVTKEKLKFTAIKSKNSSPLPYGSELSSSSGTGSEPEIINKSNLFIPSTYCYPICLLSRSKYLSEEKIKLLNFHENKKPPSNLYIYNNFVKHINKPNFIQTLERIHAQTTFPSCFTYNNHTHYKHNNDTHNNDNKDTNSLEPINIPIPLCSMGLYICVNSRSLLRCRSLSNLQRQQFLEEYLYTHNNNNNYKYDHDDINNSPDFEERFMSLLQGDKCIYKKILMDCDVDTKHNKFFLQSFINIFIKYKMIPCIKMIIETHGGFHLLFKNFYFNNNKNNNDNANSSNSYNQENTVKNQKNKNEEEKNYQLFRIELNNFVNNKKINSFKSLDRNKVVCEKPFLEMTPNEMIPIPGTRQGNFKVRIITNDHFINFINNLPEESITTQSQPMAIICNTLNNNLPHLIPNNNKLTLNNS